MRKLYCYRKQDDLILVNKAASIVRYKDPFFTVRGILYQLQFRKEQEAVLRDIESNQGGG